MNKKEITFLISEGEGYNLEFKEAYSDSISKDICAFANSNGGKILIGITDDKKIKGIKISNALKSQIQSISRNLDPKFEVFIEHIDNILIINVPEGNNKPYSTNGKFYLRQGANSQQMERNEIKEFFQKEGLVLFDEKLNYEFDIKKDVNKKAYNKFIEGSKISNILKLEDVFKNLGLIKDNHIKNAGVLLFSNKITKFFRNSTITCSLFQRKDKNKIIDSKEFDSDLYSNYENAVNYLKSKLNTEYIIKGGPREEVLELPEDALREAILNAIAHRNYFRNANIQIYIFSDRVEVVNPGGLVPGMKISDLGKKSSPRNLLLFGLMQRMDLVEKVGSGILRIRNAMKEYKLKEPLFEVNENWFSISFTRPNLQKESFEYRRGVEKVVEKVVEKLSSKEKIIISLIKKEPYISKEGIIKKGNLTKKSVEYNIAKLKKKHILKRVGPDKGGYWKVLRK